MCPHGEFRETGKGGKEGGGVRIKVGGGGYKKN